MNSNYFRIGIFLGAFVWSLTANETAFGQIMLSGNENKVGLATGNPVPLTTNVGPDSVSVLDFSHFPPSVSHLMGITNTVVGPPSNIAISPDGRLALIANSLRVLFPGRTNWAPETHVHVLDLTVTPPQIIGRVETELQPSGLSFTPDGRFALVANRASGTISALGIDGKSVKQVAVVKVCEPAENVSDVAISPDGKLALASVQRAGYLAVLKIENGQVSLTGRKLSTYGQPYRCIITPDGELGLTAGQGFGNGIDVDADAITVVDLKATPMRTIDFVAIGSVPESIEISPNGQLLAAVVMDGSNLAATDPRHTTKGTLVILKRKGRTFVVSQRLPVGAVPEGVAFTPDGADLFA